ncbi:hypothetical protein ACSLOT_28200, partial [Escherichia coli]|uniref:hypothetical protein n=1 Tax=Escherichia coli TaxID=562 RepID=UPI003EE11482
LPPIKILTTIQGVALVVTTIIAIIRQALAVHPAVVAPARAPAVHPVAVVQVQAPVAHPAMTMAGLMVFWAG